MGRRADNASVIVRLRAGGLSTNDIAAVMDLSPNTIRAYLADPDGTKDTARKVTYGGQCGACGKPTYGGNGRAKAPKLCHACHQAGRRHPHGTSARYQGTATQSGCRCDACRAANTARHRKLKGRQPRTHGLSGYTNYGCRCDICTSAHKTRMVAYHRQRKAAA